MSKIPYRNADEKIMMKKINKDYVDPQDGYAERENEYQNDEDPYERTQMEVLEGVEHTGMEDMPMDDQNGNGYLTAPSRRGGYINAPTGGFLPQLAAMVLPAIISGIVGAMTGSGRSRASMSGNVLHMRNPLNMMSTDGFYKSLYDDVSSQIGKPITDLKFKKLFAGTGYKRLVNGKFSSGGRSVDELRMGHIVMPLLLEHLNKALGKGEKSNSIGYAIRLADELPWMQNRVTPQALARGGSIFGSLWSGLKNVFGKIIGSTMGQTAIKGLEKTVEGVAPIAADALTKYASKKLKGQEPDLSEDELQKKHSNEITKLRNELELSKLRKQLEREDKPNRRSRNDEEEEAPRPSRRIVPTGQKTVLERPSKPRATNVTRLSEEEEDDDDIPPQGMTFTQKPGMRIKGTTESGKRYYGYGNGRMFRGAKKKAQRGPVGGKWVIKIT
jgi:hypothetical protein